MFIYCLPITNLLWQDAEAHLLHFVSSERQQTVLNYYHPIDQKLSLYAALLVRMQLSILTKIPNDALKFRRNLYGKPIFLSNPQYHFSLSHTHNMILCSISNQGSNGIDIETIDKDLPIKYMYESLHPTEVQYINDIPSDSQYLHFYKIWTQKEAYVKFLGTGFSTESSAINTLEPRLASHLYTWKHLNYVCSVFMPTTVNYYSISFIYESDLQEYFLRF